MEPSSRGRWSDEIVLVALGALMVLGILLGLVWVFLDWTVDVAIIALVGAGGLIWFARRRRRQHDRGDRL